MLAINIFGMLLIGLIVWWFWLYKPSSVTISEKGVEVVVANGIYEPGLIRLKANTPSSMVFIRKDESPCAEFVQFPALEISEALPVGIPKTVLLPALPVGEYAFHCQMQMYRGKVLVE